MTLISRSIYDRLIVESEDAKQYAASVSGVKPIVSSEAETEIRFRVYPPRQTHDSGVMNRVMDFLKRKVAPSSISRETSTVQLYDNNVRRMVEQDTFYKKIPLHTIDVPEFMLRCSVSREDKMNSVFKPEGKPFITRKRERTRIFYEGVNVDLTIVTVSGKSQTKTCEGEDEPKVRYEVEVEFPDLSQIKYDRFSTFIRTMFRVIRATEVPYTVTMYKMIADYYNLTLSQDSRQLTSVTGEFDGRLQSTSRPLKIKDLVFGGIVSKNVHYSVTPKADGIRTAFMVHESGIWLYGGNGMLNCLIMSTKFNDMHGTIIDTESIPMTNRTADQALKYQYFVLAFDTLSLPSNFSRGSISIQDEIHVERMKAAEAMFTVIDERLSVLRPMLLLMRTKIFRYFLSVEQYFDAVQYARNLIETKVLPYKTDGIVFTPSNLRSVPYPNIFKIKLSKRVLIDYPDIVKFKTVDMLTIDFSVDVGERQVMSSSGKGLVPFTAKGFNSAVNVAWITCERKRFPKNSIVEFSWRDEQFHPVRLRSDKEKPNALEIARDNFKHILEALTYDTVCGLNGDLMRKYHNRVKTLLYETAALSRVQLLGQKSEYTLLDLGSGEGGDIHKWAKIGFTRVVAVEPSDNNIESLRLRIEEALRSGEKEVSSYPEIEVLQAGAEDTDKIVSCAVKTLGENPKFDVISAMLSASFFFRDDSTFKSVVRTIKEHSKKGSLFLIFTINGQLIEEMMSPSMREGAILTSPLVLGDFRLDLPLDQWAEISGRQIGGDQGLKDYATGRSYNFTFKGTKTVHGAEEERDTAQIEYMVYIPMLTEALKPEFALKNHEIADKEPLLDGSYRIASSLYSYAIYQRMS